MTLSTLSVKRPVLAWVMNLTLIVLGIASLRQVEVRQFPNIDPPIVGVQTGYRGASAAVVDAEVTKRLVDQLAGIEGIRTIDSTSSEESSRIDIEFTLDRDLDKAAADVRDQIARARRELPETVDDPIVTKTSGDANPFMWISVTVESGDMTQLELSDYVDRNLAEPLSVISGVSSIRIGGERRAAVRVWLDRSAMAARGVTVEDVTRRLEAENLELPAGRIESREREFGVRAVSRLGTPQQFADLVVRDDKSVAGGRVRLGDVARVELAAENERSGFFVNSVPAVSIGIIRQSQANTVDVADAVRASLEELRQTLPPGLAMTIAADDSVFIRASIDEVVVSLLIAVGLVVLVILVFVGSVRATIVPALAIPVSVVATITVLFALDYSINVLTLLAAVLAIGLVVDDAIVVLENIERRVREGQDRLPAAIEGAREVGFAVIATTVVLVAVFVPLAFLTGQVGRLFSEFGIALAASVVFSTFVALTLAPMLCSRLLRRPKHLIDGRGPGFFGRLAARGSAAYSASVRAAVAARWAIVAATVLLAAAAWTLHERLPKELTPVEDQGRFIIIADAPEGSSLEYTQAQVRQIEDIVAPFRAPGGPVHRVISIVAPGWGGAASVSSARIIVRLHPWDQRTMSQQEIVAAIQPKLRALPGIRATAVNPAGLGVRGGQQPIQYAVGGPDIASARLWAQRVVELAQGDPRFVNLRAEFEENRPQVRVVVDRDRAFNVGLSVEQVGRTLQTFLGGREVTEFLDRGELYEVILQARPDDRATPGDISDLYVRAAGGALIPLSSVVRVSEGGTVRDIRRIARIPSVVITGQVPPGGSLGDALARLDELVRTNLPPEARVSYLGESLDYRQSSGELYLLFALSMLVVYLALAAQFESFIHPVTILIAVPLAVTGGLATLTVLGLSLNIYSQIGLIMLVGLTTKQGILVVEFANQLVARGRSVREAAVEASVVRLRPILMTAISTVLGALPLVIATGAGAESRLAIGVVIVGGLAFSTLLTLFVIPAVYVVLSRERRPRTATIGAPAVASPEFDRA